MLRVMTLLACAGAICGCAPATSRPTPTSPAPASGVTLVEKNGRFVFSSGNLAMEIDPRVGGRVVSFSLEGQNFLTGTDADPQNYGSTFWTSPQSDWGWPPPPEIDSSPYKSAVSGKSLVLSGATSPKLNVSVTKTFSFDEATSSVTIAYAIANHGSSPLSLAPWEITRVHTGGVTFFPTGSATYDYGNKSLVTTQAAAMTWFKYDAATIAVDSKLFADGSGGFLAQVDRDTVFVKKFSDVAADQHAPREAEIEIYANRAHTYVEIENQGSYGPLMPGTSTSWTVRWTLRKLPVDVDASVGSAALVAWVRGI
jgi:Domain of unknown function (DUF4380)